MGNIDGIRERIRIFVLQVIRFARKIPKDDVGKVFVNQLIRSSTSIGANFEESSEAQSNKDLIHKMSIVKKEAKETKYWIELVCFEYQILSYDGKSLIQENLELIKIFATIILRRSQLIKNPIEH